jgi:agmatinase
MTVRDVERLGIEQAARLALEVARGDGVEGVFLSFDIDSVDPAYAPGTGWPEPGGFTPREVLPLVQRIAREGLRGMEVVAVSPPDGLSELTSLLAVRVIGDVLAAQIESGTLGRTRAGAPRTDQARAIDRRAGREGGHGGG